MLASPNHGTPNNAVAHRLPADAAAGGTAVRHRGTSSSSSLHDGASDVGFITLQNAFRPSGGLASGKELATRLHTNGEGGYARLARWIVGGEVFSFAWHDHFWLPIFQFDLTHKTLRQGLRPVLSELTDVMDGWALAAWFAQPNEALQGHSPVTMWLQRYPDVYQAARLQRYVMRG